MLLTIDEINELGIELHDVVKVKGWDVYNVRSRGFPDTVELSPFQLKKLLGLEENQVINISRIKNHHTSCPSQWDLWDEEGNFYYVRYRYGSLTVEDDKQNVLLSINEDSLGGVMDTDQMIDLISDRFDFHLSQQQSN